MGCQDVASGRASFLVFSAGTSESGKCCWVDNRIDIDPLRNSEKHDVNFGARVPMTYIDPCFSTAIFIMFTQGSPPHHTQHPSRRVPGHEGADGREYAGGIGTHVFGNIQRWDRHVRHSERQVPIRGLAAGLNTDKDNRSHQLFRQQGRLCNDLRGLFRNDPNNQWLRW